MMTTEPKLVYDDYTDRYYWQRADGVYSIAYRTIDELNAARDSNSIQWDE